MQSMVAKLVPVVRAGEPVTLFRSHNPQYADGGQLRDFVDVRDCVAVVEWLLRNPSVSGLYNVGTGTARSFLDLAHAIYARLGVEPDIRFVDTPAGIARAIPIFHPRRHRQIARRRLYRTLSNARKRRRELYRQPLLSAGRRSWRGGRRRSSDRP